MKQIFLIFSFLLTSPLAVAFGPLPIESSFQIFKTTFEQATPATFSDFKIMRGGRTMGDESRVRFLHGKTIRVPFEKWGVCKFIQNGKTQVALDAFDTIQVDNDLGFLSREMPFNHTYEDSSAIYGILHDGRRSVAHNPLTLEQVYLAKKYYYRSVKPLPANLTVHYLFNEGKLSENYADSRVALHPELFNNRAISYLLVDGDEVNVFHTDIYRVEYRWIAPGFLARERKLISLPRRVIKNGKVQDVTVTELEKLFGSVEGSVYCAYYWDPKT